MYQQRKTETTTTRPSSRVPGSKTNMLKQSKTETQHVSNSSPPRPSKHSHVPTPMTGAFEGKVSFATDARSSKLKPETSKTPSVRTVRTTVTTFTSRPRIKPEKPSAPLFNVTNYNTTTGTDRGTAVKAQKDSAAPSRPSRDATSSTSSVGQRLSTNQKPPPYSRAKAMSISSPHNGMSRTPQPKQRQMTHGEMPLPILKKKSSASGKDIGDRPIPPECVRCDVCMRGFLPERLEKHREACRKMESRPKKIFNATAMRTAGTELESYIKRGAHQKDVPVKKSNWRAKHEEFLSNVREAKKVQDHLARGGKLSDLPPPRRSENPDYVPCPHCNRKFNESAAERHIPKCANIISNKKKPVSSTRSRR